MPSVSLICNFEWRNIVELPLINRYLHCHLGDQLAIVEVTTGRDKSKMCVTVLQTVYMVGLLVAVGFTMGGMLLPMWVEGSADGIGYAVGLFLNCSKLGDEVDFNNCRKIWDDLTLAEQLGAGAMFLSCATCAVAFAWSCIAYYGICCRRCMTQPLPYVTALAFVLDLTGIICIAHDREIGQIEDLTTDKELGLSIWLCVAGVAVLLFDTLVASGLALSSILCPC
ncbi:Pantothenate synthetase [Trichinella pseudospiralis]